MFKTKEDIEQAKAEIEKKREELQAVEKAFEKNLFDWVNDLIYNKKVFAGTKWELKSGYYLCAPLSSIPKELLALRTGWHCTYSISREKDATRFIEFCDNEFQFCIYEDLRGFVEEIGIEIDSDELEEKAQKLREQLAEVEKRLALVRKG